MLEERVTRFLQGNSEQGCAFYRKHCTYSPVTWGFAGERVSPESQASARRDTYVVSLNPLCFYIKCRLARARACLLSRWDAAMLVLC